MKWLSARWPTLLAHSAALLPLAWMVGDFLLNLSDYTANRALMLRSGSVGMILLVASFACTPVHLLLRWPRVVQMRRPLGVYGFLCICIHFWVYAWLDNLFMLELMLRDLGERRAMSVGLLAFLCLLPLAITSTYGWQRRLGKRWRTLHRLVYLALPLSVLHYLWLERDFLTVPIVYAVVVGLLFLSRLRWVRRNTTTDN